MDAEGNRAAITEVFDAVGRGDPTALTGAMADDCTWTFPPGSEWSGTWGPKEAVVGGLLRPLMAQFSDYRLEADDVLADGDRVVVRAHATATTLAGDDYPQRYCYVMRMRDGEIAEVIEYMNSALAERVLTTLRP